jgi:hypothetical protein
MYNKDLMDKISFPVEGRVYIWVFTEYDKDKDDEKGVCVISDLFELSLVFKKKGCEEVDGFRGSFFTQRSETLK